MGCRLPAIVVVGALLAADNPARDPAEHERKQLEGTWEVVAFEEHGETVPRESYQFTAKIRAGRFALEARRMLLFFAVGGELTGTYRLDPSKKPRAIDFEYEDVGAEPGAGRRRTTVRGIYLLDGDTLKICKDMSGQQRPREFKTEPGSSKVVLVLKRKGAE
jgi:uncharacterized protein (TIGR03067 family)